MRSSPRRWIWLTIAIALAAFAWWFSRPTASEPMGNDAVEQTPTPAPAPDPTGAPPSPKRTEAPHESSAVPPDAGPAPPPRDQLVEAKAPKSTDAGIPNDPVARGAFVVTQIADRVEKDALEAEASGDTERAEFLKIRAQRLRERAAKLEEKLDVPKPAP